MALLFPFDLYDQICELMADALDPGSHLFALALVHLPGVEPLTRAPDDGRGDLQIAQQLGARRTSRRRFLQLTPGLQKQLRLFEQALSERR